MLCNEVQREAAKSTPDLTSWLFCYVPLHNIRYGIPIVNSQAEERLTYDTQKPEALLERIIKASSNEGDLVLDCFCGSGTSAAVAEKLGRRWITCDLGRFAVHTTRKRLLSIENVKPFVVQNLGKYERQAWQAAEFPDATRRADVQLRYRQFILDLYHATPIDGYNWLHGVKSGRLVHVGSVDAPIAYGEVKAIVTEFRRATGKEGGQQSKSVDILGWDFAFEINEVTKQVAADAQVHVRFYLIPREVLEKKAVEQGDIRFYELAALDVAHTLHQRTLHLEVQNFLMSTEFGLSVNFSEPACFLILILPLPQVQFIQIGYGCSVGRQQSGETTLEEAHRLVSASSRTTIHKASWHTGWGEPKTDDNHEELQAPRACKQGKEESNYSGTLESLKPLRKRTYR